MSKKTPQSPPRKKIALVGSAPDDGRRDLAPFCRELGRMLAEHGYDLLTGGSPAVGTPAAEEFARVANDAERLVLVVRTGSRISEALQQLKHTLQRVGDSTEERHRAVVKGASLALIVGGNRGAEAETRTAEGDGVPVLPVAATGGFARELAVRQRLPRAVDERTRRDLGNETLSDQRLATTVAAAIVQVLGPTTPVTPSGRTANPHPEPKGPPQKRQRRIAVFYGGEAATAPRAELLAWLLGPNIRVDARITADGVPHSKGAVDDRVSDLIAWADAAIVLITPDAPRSTHGAPNVLDEIGRWRESKGPASMLILRQTGVSVASNHEGLVIPQFTSRVREVFEDIRVFLDSLGTGGDAGGESRATPRSGADSVGLVATSQDIALVDSLVFSCTNAEVRGEQITLELRGVGTREEAYMRAAADERRQVALAYANTGVTATLKVDHVTHRGGRTAMRLTCTDVRHAEYGGGAIEVNLGGSRPLSADEIARLRAGRILFNDPPAAASNTYDGVEGMIRGIGLAKPITESLIPGWLAEHPGSGSEKWQALRLALIRELRLSDCVEHVEVLELEVEREQLARIRLRGVRRRKYTNHPAYIVELEGPVKPQR